jgi:ribosomal protein L11 methylase PrmA
MLMTDITYENSSFRDPSGFVFYKDGEVFRAIGESYNNNLIHLKSSGLYEKLTRKKTLIPFQEVESNHFPKHKIIKAEKIEFISYAYEWSFSQLKDAALKTLEICVDSIEHGMILKDASSYNIQFHKGNPVLIDTLSFDKYENGEPWVAYKQFCQHFLAPLALMSRVNIESSSLLKNFIDGIPLDVASQLLPSSSKLNFGLLIHIHMHSKMQHKYANSGNEDHVQRKIKSTHVSKMKLLGILDSLKRTIEKLNWKDQTEWGDYYSFTNYNDESFKLKANIIKDFLKKSNSKKVVDLGANNGHFSRVACEHGADVISCDIDPIAVEKNYLTIKQRKEHKLTPLRIDLTNPSPSIGWSNEERTSFSKRLNCDTAMALAVIHHLVISNNIPFKKVARYISSFCNNLIIEFVPKSDSQVQTLLMTRKDIFPDYNIETFEQEFKIFFPRIEKIKIQGSERHLFLMKK